MIKVAFVIDESGSMGGRREEIIDLVNDQIKELDSVDSYFYTFSDKPRRIGKNLKEFSDYTPAGMTALHDGVRMAIEEMSENDRYDDKYLVLVISDGMENCSKTTKPQLMELINSKKDRWTFTYLGGTKDLSKDAVASYNYSVGNTSVFEEDLKKNSRIIARGLNNYVTSYGAKTDNFFGE